MAIKRAESSEQDDDLGFIEDSEDGQQYTFTELMNAVTIHKDVIVIIPADQEVALRKGLAVRKSKDNAKLRNAGLVADNSVLKFLVYPVKDNPELVNVRIKLGARSSITVHEMVVPDDTL